MTITINEAADRGERKPLVSIGMPVRNGANTLRVALDSLLAQTFADFELLISDNDSTDDTEAICREYETLDERVRYVRQQKNIGVVSNFQFVVDRARGDYFMWAAHDDTWGAKYIEAGIRVLVANPKAVAAIGVVKYLDTKGEVFGADFPPYTLNGDTFFRVCNYLRTNITDHLIYGLYKTDFLFHNQLNTKVLCAEKQVILRAVIAGGFEDAPGMTLYVKYSYRPRSDLRPLGLNPAWWQGFYSTYLMGQAILRQTPRRITYSLLWSLLRHRTPFFNRILRGKLRPHPGRITYPTRSSDQW